MGFLDDIKKIKKFGDELVGLQDELQYLKKHNFFARFEELIKNMEDMTKYMKEMKETINTMNNNMEYMLTLNKTMDKMSKNMELMLSYTKELNENTEGMLQVMKELNNNITSFNITIKNIAENTQSLDELEKRISLPGFVISSIRDLFVLIAQIIRIAILQNIRRIRELVDKKF